MPPNDDELTKGGNNTMSSKNTSVVRQLQALMLVVLVLTSSSCGHGQNSTIRIGMTSPLTGPAAESGIALREGALLAVDEINAAGGIEVDGNKYEVELLVEDTESKPEVGVSAAERLITKEKVHYLIGDAILSSVTMAIMELAPKYQIPVVSGESVSEAIVDKVRSDPEKYRYFWKMNFGSTTYADSVFRTVNWLLDEGEFQPDTKTVFFIVEDTDYGRSNAGEAAELFERIGWSTVAVETVPMGHTDLYPQLTKLRAADADILISIFTPLSSGVALVKQFRELDINALHIAVYYPTRPEFMEQVDQAGEGLLWTPLAFDPRHLHSHEVFAEKVQSNFSTQATIDHAYGYDFIHNATDSIDRADSLEPARIIEAVASLDRRGVIGRYVFDQEDHQVMSGSEFIPVPTAQIQGGHSFIIWPRQLASGTYRSQPWVK